MKADVRPREPLLVRRLRVGLLALAAIGVIGTGLELAFIRHWQTPEQLIPWFALGVLGGIIVLIAVRPTRLTLRAARLLSVATLASGLYGVVSHIAENLDAGPLDRVYGAKWDSMSTLAQWWAAATGGVGPAPTLAPAVLSQISLCLLLATVGRVPTVEHP